MFLIDYSLTNGILWENINHHDGVYISNVYTKCRDKWVFIDETMSYYNKLT